MLSKMFAPYLWPEASSLETKPAEAKKYPLTRAVKIAITSGTVKQKLVIIISQQSNGNQPFSVHQEENN